MTVEWNGARIEVTQENECDMVADPSSPLGVRSLASIAREEAVAGGAR